MKTSLIALGIAAAALLAPSAQATIISSIYTYGGSEYFLVSSNTWTGAEAEAVSLGGHLVTINDAAENAFVASTFGRAWIGFNDAASEGNFVWSSGESSAFTSWNSGEPNNSGGEDYTETLGNGLWNDLPNHISRPGIVERARVPEGGATLALLGMSIFGIGFAKRRLS